MTHPSPVCQQALAHLEHCHRIDLSEQHLAKVLEEVDRLNHEMEATKEAARAREAMLRAGLAKCADELELTARSEFEGVWAEQDFIDMCAPYRTALNGEAAE